jgi:hypothetical protein
MRCVACQGKQPSAVFVDRSAEVVAAAVIYGQQPPRIHPQVVRVVADVSAASIACLWAQDL